MEQQALRDAVVRYNAEGLAGLHNRRAPPRPGKLDAAELRALSELILSGRMAVFRFVEGWYNPTRRHSGLSYLSPIADEEKMSAEP